MPTWSVVKVVLLCSANDAGDSKGPAANQIGEWGYDPR